MEVILMEKIANLGELGQVVKAELVNSAAGSGTGQNGNQGD